MTCVLQGAESGPAGGPSRWRTPRGAPGPQTALVATAAAPGYQGWDGAILPGHTLTLKPERACPLAVSQAGGASLTSTIPFACWRPLPPMTAGEGRETDEPPAAGVEDVLLGAADARRGVVG